MAKSLLTSISLTEETRDSLCEIQNGQDKKKWLTSSTPVLQRHISDGVSANE